MCLLCEHRVEECIHACLRGIYIGDLLYDLSIRAYIRKYLHREGELTVLTRIRVNLKRLESSQLLYECIL